MSIIYLITGSTDGIGQQTALELAQDHRNLIIIHGRSEEKCKKTINFIEKKTKNHLEYIVADLSSLQNVHSMSAEIMKRFPYLDGIILNAGVLCPQRKTSIDGYELTLAVNHLSHFLLSLKLIEWLSLPSVQTYRANRSIDSQSISLSNTFYSDPIRFLVMSSLCYSWYHLDWTDLQTTMNYEKYLCYSRSKLCNHLFAFELHRRLSLNLPFQEQLIDETPIESTQNQQTPLITVNVIEPGVIQTKLLAAGGFSGSHIKYGSASSIFALTSPKLLNKSGVYITRQCQIEPVDPEFVNIKDQIKLWNISLQLVGIGK